MPEDLSQYDSLERYETVLKHIHDAVYTLDPNGQITWVNETAVENFDIGYDREDLIGAPVSIVLNEEDIEKALEIIQRCLQSDDRNSGRCEIAIQTAYGGEIPCDLHLALLPFEDGEFQGTVGVVREITDRKLREQQLEVQNRALRHNLRNDMNVILGLAEDLESAVDEDNKQDVRTIREVGEKLLELSEKVRSMSEIQEWSAADEETVDLFGLLESLVDEFQDTYPDVKFDYEVTADEPVQRRIATERFLDLAMRNLLKNSIEHNDSNNPRVSISVDTDGNHGTVRVEDNGPGIPQVELEVLGRESESALQHSSGMGLWIVNWCVTKMGGDLRFEEATPHGTIVTLDLPTRRNPPDR